MRFDYHRPSSVAEAIELLGTGEGRRPLTFGSDLLVWAKEGVKRPEAVIDLTGVDGLDRIEPAGDHLRLGACAPLGAVGRDEKVRGRFPALAEAIESMGSIQLREGASLGGNVCTASPAGDSAPPLLCYDATMIAAGPGGERRLPAESFYTGPGDTALWADELLVGVELPWPREGAVGCYLKGARRIAVDLALVSVAAVAWADASTPSGLTLRIALGAVAPTPIRAAATESLVAERGLPAEPHDDLGRAIAATARESAHPIDDIRATAAYRTTLVGELAARACVRLSRQLSHTSENRRG